MVQQCRRCGQAHDAYAACPHPGRALARAATDDESLLDKIVADRYRLTHVLGHGSTGTVFAVEHVNFGRAGTMKVLRARHMPADHVSRVFYGEARAAWSVTHPCLCEVFDIGTLPDGTPYFVAERLEGETLANRIARERMSLASAVDMIMQVLSAVAAIHARDLLLRDLRPKNVFLANRRGCRPLVKILDFGLARLTPLERIQHDWATGPAHGSPGATQALAYYLSPERTRGEHLVEPGSDLFACGLILYEALTGERPFAAASFDALLGEVRRGAPPPLHERRPEISADVSAFVARVLSPTPRQRPASAKEMQDELRAIFESSRRASGHHAAVKAPLSARDFEAGREGPAVEESTFASMTSAPPSVTSPAIPARMPEAQRAAVAAQPLALTINRRFADELPDLHDLQDVYSEETETKRERSELVEAFEAIERLGPRTLAPSTMPRPVSEGPRIDEASAESSDRTVPPPARLSMSSQTDGSVEIDISALTRSDADPPSELDGPPRLARETEEEETETMELNPALRARLEQLVGPKPAPVRTSAPPPVVHPSQPVPVRTAPPPSSRGAPTTRRRPSSK